MIICVRVHLSRNPSNSGERDSIAPPIKRLSATRKITPPTNDRREPWARTAQLNAMMKSGAAESAPLLQRDETQETNKPKPGAIAAAVRQAKRGVGVFGVALALSGVLVAVLNAPDTTKRFELGLLRAICVVL